MQFKTEQLKKLVIFKDREQLGWINLPHINSIYGRLLASDMISVQPLSPPTGNVFHRTLNNHSNLANALAAQAIWDHNDNVAVTRMSMDEIQAAVRAQQAAIQRNTEIIAELSRTINGTIGYNRVEPQRISDQDAAAQANRRSALANLLNRLR